MNAARQNEQSIFHTFFKYVSSNVLGMIGFSCYILADVFFIAAFIKVPSVKKASDDAFSLKIFQERVRSQMR